MDNDDLRYGKPTNHKVFGEAMAVLAEGLLNLAYEIMLADAVKIRITGFKNQKQPGYCQAGISGMIAGQVMDMEAENRDISYEELCIMHKTEH